jgi:type IV fimbrial biogenesis protein FimT
MRHRRGFSILEIVVTVAIVAVVVSIGIPGYFAMMHRGQANQQMRFVVDDLALARSQAGTGGTLASAPTVHVRSAGVRLVSATSYEIIQTDSITGQNPTNLDIIKIVNLSSSSGIAFTSPSSFPTDIMFKSNGTLASGSPSQVVLHDAQSHLDKTLQISLTGSVRMY